MTIELTNNTLIRDFQLSNGTVIPDFSKKQLEFTYFLRNEKEVSSFLANMKQYSEGMLEIRDKLKFERMTCIFDTGVSKLDEKTQKILIDFQNESFDDITVHLIEGDIETFRKILNYAKANYNKPVMSFVDLGLAVTILATAIQTIAGFNLDGTKWKYRKIDSFIDRYRLVEKNMKSMNMPYYLSMCWKRCSIKGFEDIAISVIARGYFGFNGTCIKYWYPKERGFSQDMDSFNESTYLWEKKRSEDFRNNRLKDFVKLNELKLSPLEINKRPKVKNCFNYLNNL